MIDKANNTQVIDHFLVYPSKALGAKLSDYRCWIFINDWLIELP
jgi:hypothetical protein